MPSTRRVVMATFLSLCFVGAHSAVVSGEDTQNGSRSRRDPTGAGPAKPVQGVDELLALGDGEWPNKCSVAPIPEGFDETIKVEHLLHHAAVIRDKYSYPRPPHIILVDDSRLTSGGLTNMAPDEVPFNTILRVEQLPRHWGWGVNGDLLLWDKDKVEGKDSWEEAVKVLHERVREKRREGVSVHVVFDWDNTLHSAGGWTSGKINRWRGSHADWRDRDPSRLDQLNPDLLEYALAGTDNLKNVTFGVATHNSFHKGEGRGEEEVFAADLVLYWFHLVAEKYGVGKFEVVTSGRPDRVGGSVNLWVPIAEVENGHKAFCRGVFAPPLTEAQ